MMATRREYQRLWRARNPERARAISRNWRARNLERSRAHSRTWYARNRVREAQMSRVHHLKVWYGITEAQYQCLLVGQNGVCALCGSPPKTRRLAVDHDHQTGRVRGLLCDPCNRSLGKVERVGLTAIRSYLSGRSALSPQKGRAKITGGGPGRGGG